MFNGKRSWFVALTVLSVVGSCGLARAEVVFDGMTWYHSHDRAERLCANEQGHLVWKCQKPDQLVVRLKEPGRLAEVSDVVEFRCLWKSSGDVIGEDCRERLCHDDCVKCLAGTGDFRVGLFDAANGRYITSDGAGLESDVFKGWKGYQWRFSPHLQATEPKRWYEPKPDGSRESHTNLRFWKRVSPLEESLLNSRASWSTLDYEPFAGGFAVPQGKFTDFAFRLERLSETDVKVSLTLNGKTFSRSDGNRSNQPEKIDVFAIHMPNARPYHEVVFAPARQRSRARQAAERPKVVLFFCGRT